MATLALGLRTGRHRPPGGAPSYGPELITTPVGTGWTASAATVTLSASGASFLNAASLDNAFLPITFEDNTTYRVEIEIDQYTTGAVKARLFGATAAHSAIFAAGKTGVGIFVEEITTNGPGASVNRASIQASSGTFRVVRMSVKKKLT